VAAFHFALDGEGSGSGVDDGVGDRGGFLAENPEVFDEDFGVGVGGNLPEADGASNGRTVRLASKVFRSGTMIVENDRRGLPSP
jgi:hypothetical protein